MVAGASGRRDGEIDLSEFDFLEGANEFARFWAKRDGPTTCVIEPRALGADPFMFGMAMADAVRHGAKAYAHAVGISETEALERIWAGFDAEREWPTDQPREIGPDGSTIQ
jgi:hypothetical protein